VLGLVCTHNAQNILTVLIKMFKFIVHSLMLTDPTDLQNVLVNAEVNINKD